MSKKVVFISTVNIFDKKANGGEKASCEHFRMLQNCFGKDNVFAILFVPKVEIDKVKENAQIKVIPKINGNAKLFIAALFGCRVYMPWKEKNILKDIDKASIIELIQDERKNIKQYVINILEQKEAKIPLMIANIVYEHLESKVAS